MSAYNKHRLLVTAYYVILIVGIIAIVAICAYAISLGHLYNAIIFGLPSVAAWALAMSDAKPYATAEVIPDGITPPPKPAAE